MRSIRTLAFGLAAALTLLSCGDDGTGPGPETLAGTWTATRFEYVDATDATNRVELIGLGGTLVVQLQGNGTFSYAVTFPGEPDETSSGTWSSTADTFTMQESGSSFGLTFDFVLAGNTLTLTGADTEYDFDDDGVDDEAELNITLVR
jgi:hypothetical protein